MIETEKKIKVKYVREEKAMFFEHGTVYNAIIPNDAPKLLSFYFTEEENDEAGWCAFPASWFEEVNDGE